MNTLKNSSGLNEMKSILDNTLAGLFSKNTLHTKKDEDALLRKQLRRLGKTEQEQRMMIEKLYRSLIF